MWDWLSLSGCICPPGCLDIPLCHYLMVECLCGKSCWLSLSVSMFQINKPLSVGFCLHRYFGYLSYLSTCASSEPGSLHPGWRRPHGLADPNQWSRGHEDADFTGGYWPGAGKGIH